MPNYVSAKSLNIMKDILARKIDEDIDILVA